MVFGDPASWAGLLDGFVPRILYSVLEAWQTLPPISRDEREDEITRDLCRALRRTRDGRTLPFQIHTQQVELNSATQSPGGGRIDIVFNLLVPNESMYFSVEAKRLNVIQGNRVRRYASEYVREGMLRYVVGRYAATVRHGAMLGCVFDGDVTTAIARVERNVAKRHAELDLMPPYELRQSSVMPKNNRIRETFHKRQFVREMFCLHHLFVVPALLPSDQ